MKKILKFLVFFLVPSAYLLVPSTALAVCPICTVAVAGGLGLSRYFGVDDTISGIWIGGLILSSSLWFINWLSKKFPKIRIVHKQSLRLRLKQSLRLRLKQSLRLRLKQSLRLRLKQSLAGLAGNSLFIILLMYAIVLLPLAWTGVIGHPFNTIWGIDKLILGTALGSLGFWGGMRLDKKIRKIKGKQFFKYQKIILPVSFLVILSVLMYFYGGYLK